MSAATTEPPREMPVGPAAYDIGIDVGGTTARVVAIDSNDEILAESSFPSARGAAGLVDQLADAVARMATSIGAAPRLVGVGVPGGVQDGVVSNALNIGIDDAQPLRELLAARIGVPVWIENDVNAAAFGADGELARGGVGSLTYLSIGTGFAAGSVIDGHLVRGAHGLSGELGHVPIPGRVEPCPCGQTGCIETLASGRAIIARMREVGLDGDVMSLWSAADDGHPDAVEIRRDVVDVIAWACQLSLMFLDVEQVVIGGGVGLALGDRLIADLRAHLATGERTSPLLAAFGMSDRVRTAPRSVELGARGARRAAQRFLPIEGERP